MCPRSGGARRGRQRDGEQRDDEPRREADRRPCGAPSHPSHTRLHRSHRGPEWASLPESEPETLAHLSTRDRSERSVVAVVLERVAAAELAAARVALREVRPHHVRLLVLGRVRDVVELEDVTDLVRRDRLDVDRARRARRRPLVRGAEPDVRLDRGALRVVPRVGARDRAAAVLVARGCPSRRRSCRPPWPPSCRRLSLVGRGRVRLVLDAAPVDVVRPLALRVPDRLDRPRRGRCPSVSRRSTTSVPSSRSRRRSSPARSCRTSPAPACDDIAS